MANKIGVCPKCLSVGVELTFHHMFPKKWFGGGPKSRLALCRDCHDHIEAILPRRKLKKYEYKDITEAFLRGQPIMIV